MIVDRTGDVFGTLKVIQRTNKKKGTTYLYDCYCEACGNTKQFTSNELKNKKSCGCLRWKGTPKDITGQKKGKLTAVKSTGNKSGNGDYIWLFKCDCGNLCERNLGLFNHSKTLQSCGCARHEIKERMDNYHGLTNTAEYTSWRKIKERCYSVSCQDYKDYGQQGIRMSDEWYNSFKQFYEDMGGKPNPKCTVDRIDSSKDYCKENCRWSLPSVQARNTRSFRGQSKYKGVHLDKKSGKWVAQFRLGGSGNTKIGRYDNEDHAAAAYNLATKLIFGEGCEYTILNDTPSGDDVVNTNCKFFTYWVDKMIEEKYSLYNETKP